MSRWFRHYAGLCRDEKLVSVAIKAKQPVERVVWVWCAILESAAEIDDDGRYSLDEAEAAYFLRTDEADIRAIGDALRNAERLVEGRVVAWGKRQFSSDRSRERVAAYRERKRADGVHADDPNPSRNGDVTLQKRHGNAPETETETDISSLRSDSALVRAPTRKKASPGSRISPEWHPSDAERQMATALGMPADQIDRTAARFRDYWSAKPGKDGVKLDWSATWRNWCDRECERRGWRPVAECEARAGPSTSIYITPDTHLDAWLAWKEHRGGKALPMTKDGGWYVPTLYPPQSTETQH
jgi:hypothetical protein